MRERAPTVEDFYDRIAPVYDWLATAPLVRSWRAMAADALALSPGDTVVEMGCGTGANLPVLRERVGAQGRVLGLDLTPGMLAQAHERVERRGWENVAVCRADATQPPVAGVDAILESFVVGLLPDPEAAVGCWVDAVRPGGRVALLEAGRSERALAAPLNLAFRGFVRAASAGGQTSRRSPAVALDRHIATAQDALTARTVDRTYRTAGAGLVQLTAGTRPE